MNCYHDRQQYYGANKEDPEEAETGSTNLSALHGRSGLYEKIQLCSSGGMLQTRSYCWEYNLHLHRKHHRCCCRRTLLWGILTWIKIENGMKAPLSWIAATLTWRSCWTAAVPLQISPERWGDEHRQERTLLHSLGTESTEPASYGS